jgi:hypothetical protein
MLGLVIMSLELLPLNLSLKKILRTSTLHQKSKRLKKQNKHDRKLLDTLTEM